MSRTVHVPNTHAASLPQGSDNTAPRAHDYACTQHRCAPHGITRRSFSACLAAAAVGTLGLACTACGSEEGQSEDDHLVASAVPTDAAAPGTGDAPAPSQERRVTFCAVGDNLANERTLELAEMWGGAGAGDGVYDFSPLYREIAPIVSSFDIAFVNQETVLGGNTDWDWSGYPSYNTPDSMAQALVDAGFDVVSSNTNHTYDYWTGPIEHMQQLWKGYPNIAFIGSYADEADRDQVRVVERKGAKVAFLSYSYGQNGYEQYDLPNNYYAVPWDIAAFARDYGLARAAADVVVVYMHGGDEYTSVPNDWQREVAQTCADAGVDLVIGSHAHVIQNFEQVPRTDGSGTMPCVFGMGDFVSSYTDYPETVLSAMFSCDIVVSATGVVSIENLAWTPLVEYWTYSADGTPDDYVRLVSTMSAEEAANDYLLSSLGSDALPWMQEHTAEVVGNSGITVK